MMIECVQITSRYMQEPNLCTELHTEVDVDNIPSLRVSERCGYNFCIDNANREYFILTKIMKVQ